MVDIHSATAEIRRGKEEEEEERRRNHRTKNTKYLKSVPPLTFYNLDTHNPIAIIFGSSVTKKIGNQTIL